MIPTTRLVQPSFLDMQTGCIRSQEALPLFSPVRLQAIAHLYGVETASLETARVLELGCHSPQQLLLFAKAYPHAQVLGICHSAAEQAEAALNASQSDIHNAQFISLDLTQIDTNLGSFDFIIVRNQYSALPSQAAQFLLQTIEALLSENGLACVDYDIYPGAKIQEVIRDAMLMNCADTDASQAFDMAKTALALFKNGRVQQGPLTEAFLGAAQHLEAKLDAEGVHSVLGAHGAPCYFIEFTSHAAQAGLACVGDAEPQRDITTLYGGEVPLINSMLTLGKPAAMRLQYLDFSTGRAVRSTLLTRLSRGTGTLVKPKLDRLQQLRWASAFKRAEGRIEKEGRTVFSDYTGRELVSTSILMTAILDSLAHIWPSSLHFDSLANIDTIKTAYSESANTEKSIIIAIATIVEQLFCNDALYYCLDAGPYDQFASTETSPVLANQMQPLLVSDGAFPSSKKLSLYNLWSEPLELGWSTADRFAITTIHTYGLAIAVLAPNSVTSINGSAETLRTENSGSLTKAGANIPPQLIERLHWLGLIHSNPKLWLNKLHETLTAQDKHTGYWSLLISALAKQSIQRQTELIEQDYSVATAASIPPQALAQAAQIDTLLAQGAYDQVKLLATQLLGRHPELTAAKLALADALMLNGDNQKALQQLLSMTDQLAVNSKAIRILARVLLNVGHYEEAIAVARRLLELNSKSVDGYLILDNCYIQLCRFTESEACCRKLLSLLPDQPTGYINLARSLCELGQPDDAVNLLAGYLEKKPDAAPNIYANLLYSVNYSTERTASEIFSVYQDFDRNVCSIHRKSWRPHKNNRNINRKIKIAYVSADFKQHAVAKFLEPLLENHDKSLFEITAYANQTIEDETTLRFKDHVDRWVPVFGLNDDALANRIRTDEIDILIDVSGHTSGNRLQVFARKPAPVSLTWMGFGYTTGVGAIDYFLGDNDLCPEGSEHLFAEQPWRLPITNYVYRTDLEKSGPVGQLPATKKGYITLGTLTRSLRINDKVISVWAKILNSLPTAKLSINSRSYADLLQQEKIINQFSNYGINQNRLILGYSSPPWDILRSIDIGLDCFPHNSGTTLFDMLSMGVPYVTLTGRPSVGRLGASILRGVGHPEWIANSIEEYIEKVVALANDLPQLENIRMTLRDDLKNSSMMDEPRFTREVENAYKEMFKKWANRKT